MKICILSTNDNVEEIRIKAREIDQFASHRNLSIACSETGELPASHWLCTFEASEETAAQLMALQDKSEMVLSEPKEFLRSKNLKIINIRKIIRDNRKKYEEEPDESEDAK
jgi:hypothetical protein